MLKLNKELNKKMIKECEESAYIGEVNAGFFEQILEKVKNLQNDEIKKKEDLETRLKEIANSHEKVLREEKKELEAKIAEQNGIIGNYSRVASQTEQNIFNAKAQAEELREKVEYIKSLK